MVISYITATHNDSILRDNLSATLSLIDTDELVVIRGASSIAKAYNEGQAKAANRIHCYIHHDIQVLDNVRLRSALIRTCNKNVGIVGVIGSRTKAVPWWDGDKLGSAQDSRMGALDFGIGGNCSMLDGILLATAQDLQWDETYPGFHLYDHDICMQMLQVGRTNLCLTNGKEIVLHNTSNSSDVSQLAGWSDSVVVFDRKWVL